MEYTLISLLNGLAYGLLLFMLSSGLTLIFGMMGVLNFTHASFYMLGAYFAFSIGIRFGFWAGVAVAPLLVGCIGAVVERFGLRNVHRHGHVAELLLTFGLAYVFVELVQVFWGRFSLPYEIPKALNRPLFTLYSTTFPMYRAFMMLVAVVMMGAIYLVLTRTRIGLVVQASLTHPQSVESLGHDVPRVFMLVFGGGCALAGLAGAIGGAAFVTEPSMAATMGTIIFAVVVIGGLGSLTGAMLASLLIGILQTYAVGIDLSLADLLTRTGLVLSAGMPGYDALKVTVSQIAPLLPYLLLVLVLLFRPKGLLGTRES
jgi:branched-chain amino acid transport system permease protein